MNVAPLRKSGLPAQGRPSAAERLRKADTTWEVLEELARHLEPGLRDSFMKAILETRAQINPGLVERYLASRDVNGLVSYILGDERDFARLYLSEFTATSQAASLSMAREFSRQIGVQQLGMTVRLESTSFQVQNALKNYSLNLIREIDQGTREGIRDYVSRQLAEGANPREIIPQLAGYVQPDGGRAGGVVGLTSRQALAVQNYRKLLESGDSAALTRALRDKRYDRSVRAGKMTPEKIDRAVQRYENRYLAYRAEVIARTESMRSLAQGQRAAWEAAIADGLVKRGSLQKTWHTARDERVRDTHQEMERVTVGFDELFNPTDTGPIWGPPEAVQCRCVAFIKPRVERVINL